MADIQSQIAQQRQSISQQQSQLAQARQQQLPSQAELRGTQRGVKGVASALMRKIGFGKKVAPYEKAMKQVSGQAQSFEQEVAQKAPEYANPELVKIEYQKAKSQLDPKIQNLQNRLFNYQKGLKEAESRGLSDETIKDYEIDIRATKAELETLKSYISDPFKAIKGVSSGQAFREAASEADYIYDKSKAKEQQNKQAQQIGFKNYSDYLRNKPVLDKLSQGTATQQDISKLPWAVKEKITYKDVPSQELGGITSQSKIEGTGGYFVDPKTGQGMSSMQDLTKEGYVKVGDVGTPFSQVARINEQIKIDPFKSYQQQSIFQPKISDTKLVTSEISRYENLGYSPTEASILGRESTKVGGMTFDPRYAQELIYKAPSREGWSYQPSSQMFVQTAPGVPEGSSSTLYMQPPTPQERLMLEDINRKGSLGYFSDTLREQVYQPISESTTDFLERLQARGTQARQFVGGKKEIPIWNLDSGFAEIGEVGGVQSTEEILKVRELEGKDKFSKIGGMLVPYTIPILGGAFYASDIERGLRDYDYDPLKAFGDKPVETSLLFAPLAAWGGLKAGSFAFGKNIFKEVPGGFKQTSRFDEFFGTRIRLSEPRAGLKYEILPSTRGRYFEQLKIDKPIADLKTYPLGADLGKKVKFTEQQLEQFGKAGQRTRVKEIKEGFFGRIKEKELFSGVTYKQPGKYQDQLQYLKDLGYTEKQAREFLRYKQPKVSKQLLEGEVNIKDSFGVGKFTTRLEKPVIDVDKSLGIKTRGGKTDIKTFSDIRIPTKGGALTIGAGAEAKIGRNILNLRGADFETGVLGAKTLRSGRVGEYVFKDVLGVSGKVKVPFDNRGFIETSRSLLVKKVPKEDKVFSFKGGGKKSSPEYIQSLYAPELKQAPRIKEIPKTKPTQESKLELPKVTETTPLPIVEESKYAGTGLYERTEEYGAMDLKPEITSIISPVIMGDSFIKTNINLDTGLKFKQPSRVDFGEKLDVKPKLDIGIKPLEKIKIGEKIKVVTKTTQATKPIQVLRTGLRTPRPKETIKRPIPKRPFKIKFKLPESKKIKRRITKRRKGDEEFLAITKRYGKEVVIAKGKDLGRIVEAGKQRVKKTLGATLKVKTTKGKQIGLGPTRGFRKSKVDPLSIVQIRETRLGSLGERSEIKKSRRGVLSVI